MFAKRTNWSLTPNKLISRLDTLKKEGCEIIDLTESNPTRCGFSYPPKKIMAALSDEKNLVYEPTPFGIQKAREAVRTYCKEKGHMLNLQQIALTSSTSEAYSVLFRLLVNNGEQILVPKPSYPLFEYLTQLNDAQIEYYPLFYDHDWKIDLDALAASINDKTRIILLVNPNNPTGSYVKKEEIAEINRLCQKHDVSIICDEVFLDYEFSQENNQSKSLVDNKDTLTFVLGGISKSLGLPQMKLAWIVTSGPQKLVNEALSRLEIILDTYLSVNTPSQNAISQWLSLRGQIQKNILERINHNRQFIEQNIAQAHPCLYYKAQGGWYAALRLPEKHTEEKWVMKFLDEDHVFVHPGYFFDFDESPVIVMSLLLPSQTFEEAFLRILEKIKRSLS